RVRDVRGGRCARDSRRPSGQHGEGRGPRPLSGAWRGSCLGADCGMGRGGGGPRGHRRQLQARARRRVHRLADDVQLRARVAWRRQGHVQARRRNDAADSDSPVADQRYSAFTPAIVFAATPVGAAPSAASTSLGRLRSDASVPSRKELDPMVSVAVAVSVTPPAAPVTLIVSAVPVPSGGTVKLISRLRVCRAARDTWPRAGPSVTPRAETLTPTAALTGVALVFMIETDNVTVENAGAVLGVKANWTSTAARAGTANATPATKAMTAIELRIGRSVFVGAATIAR